MTDSLSMSETANQNTALRGGSRAFLTIIQLIATIAVPILLTLLSVRAVMTPLFLQIEYHRPGFPEDFYGFTREDRLTYAPYALDYLLNGEGIAYLGDLTFADGSPLYTDRELQHMVDVKVVTRAAFHVLLFGGAGFVLLGIVLWRNHRRVLARGLIQGAIVTLSIIAAIIVVTVVAWDTFFTTFHELFFAEGTWIFRYSDTLIRLFPEAFWFDASLTIGVLTTAGAFGVLIFGYRMRRKHVLHTD